MQNRYVGDVGDFGKYGLLRRLTEKHSGGSGLSLGVAWYLFPDEGHNSDGKHIAYLNKPGFKNCDAELYREMQRIVCDSKRNIGAIEHSDVLPKATTFHNTTLTFDDLPAASGKTGRQMRAARREAWVTEMLEATVGKDLIFFDPDNGFQCKSKSIYGDKGPKYVYWSDILSVQNRDQSVVIYHHLHQGEKASVQVRTKVDEIRENLRHGDNLIPILYRRGTLRCFFVIPTDRHLEPIRQAIDSLMDGPWAQHFQRFTPRTTSAPSAGSILCNAPVYRHPMLAWLKWVGTGMGIAGALVVALNLPFSGWGFVLFLVSSVSWTVAGLKMREHSLALLNGVFTAVNLLGIYRWLIA